MPAAVARSRAPTAERSETTATTRAGYPSSSPASSRACRRLPDPEARTTTRAGAGSRSRCCSVVVSAAPGPGVDVAPRLAADATTRTDALVTGGPGRVGLLVRRLLDVPAGSVRRRHPRRARRRPPAAGVVVLARRRTGRAAAPLVPIGTASSATTRPGTSTQPSTASATGPAGTETGSKGPAPRRPPDSAAARPTRTAAATAATSTERTRVGASGAVGARRHPTRLPTASGTAKARPAQVGGGLCGRRAASGIGGSRPEVIAMGVADAAPIDTPGPISQPVAATTAFGR